jgi:hypothetical protein
MKYLSRPDIQLYLLAILAFAAGTLLISNSALDIHLSDTWNFSESMKTPGGLSVFIALEGLLYTITRRFRQLRWLQVLHVISMVCLPIIFFLYIQPSMPRRYFDYGDSTPALAGKPFYISMLIAGLIFITGQIAFIANLITGFSRGRKGPQDGEPPAKYSSFPVIPMLVIGLALPAAGILNEFFNNSPFLSTIIPAVVIGALFIFEAMVYWLTAGFRQWLVFHRIHIASSLAAVVTLFLSYYSISMSSAAGLSTVLLWFALIAFFAGQIAFITNVTAGFFRGRKHFLN